MERQYYTYCTIEFDNKGHGAEPHNIRLLLEYVSGRTRRMDETLDYCLFFVLTNNPYIGRTDG
jgi:hypothetical protein